MSTGRDRLGLQVDDLVAMSVQRRANRGLHARIDRFGTSQVAPLLLGQTASQVTGAALTMHALALGGQPKAFFGAFMGFDLGSHDSFNG